MLHNGNIAGRAQVRGRGRPYVVPHKDGRDLLDLTVWFYCVLFGGQVCSLCCEAGWRWRSDFPRLVKPLPPFIRPATLHYRFAVYTGGRLSNVSSETPPEGKVFRRATLFSTISHILATRHRVRYVVAFRIRFNRASSSSRDVQGGSEGPRG